METKKDLFEFWGMDDNLGALIPYRNFYIKSWCQDIPLIKKCLSFKDTSLELNIVEIGVQGGGSLLKTFDLIENKKVNLWGIDIWEYSVDFGSNGYPKEFWTEESRIRSSNLLKECRINLENILKEYDKKNQVKLIHGSSRDNQIISQFKDESIDILYIDGDHGFQGCYLDLLNWYPKVKRGGYIINDDYFSFETVRNAINQFCKDISMGELVIENGQSYFLKR